MLINQLLSENVKNIFHTFNDGIIITDENSVVLFINRAYTLFSGIKPTDIVGRYLPEVRPGAILPQVLESLEPIVDAPRKVGKAESYCDFLPIVINGKLIGGMVVVKDVTRIESLLRKIKDNKEKIIQLDTRIKESFQARYMFQNMIGIETGLKEVYKESFKAAQTDSPVLLAGESGTGKEVIAQSIHNESKRREMPFVDVNCAALPEHLLESELFGYTGGAFTGAKKSGKLGLFEIADGGTLFLDEITEMPLSLQTKLLRAFEEKKIRKIGAEKSTKVDIRLIAATNKNILKMVDEKKFRDDLYFRLAVFHIKIPPLRERTGDISLLVERFVRSEQEKKKCALTTHPEVMKVLEGYNWPGNVRELLNAIEYSANVTEDNIIKVEDLPRHVVREKVNFKRLGGSLEETLLQVEKEVISENLRIYGSSVEGKKQISRELKISLATLYNKLKKHGF